MSTPQEAPYGTWKSSLSADIFGEGTVSLEEVVVNVYAVELTSRYGGAD